MANSPISGVVFNSVNKQVVNAAILLTKLKTEETEEPTTTYEARTDKNGRYHFPEVIKGTYNIQVLKEDYALYDSGKLEDNKTLELDPDKSLIWDVSLRLLTDYTEWKEENEKAGKRFLTVLSVSLLSLSILYVILHISLKCAGGPLSYALLQNIVQAEGIIDTLKSDNEKILEDKVFKTAEKELVDSSLVKYLALIQEAVKSGKKIHAQKQLDSLKTNAQDKLRPELLQALKDKLESIKELDRDTLFSNNFQTLSTGLAKTLVGNYNMLTSDKLQYTQHLKSIEKAYKNNDIKKVSDELSKLLHIVKQPLTGGFIPWTRAPWQSLEILFWALAGVLVRKIILSGYYLRRDTFLRKGIYMHVSHFVGVPFLVLVAMMLLSLVTFSFSLDKGGQPIIVNLSDPRMLAAFSFMLATGPWAVWNFVEDAGEKLLSGLESTEGTK